MSSYEKLAILTFRVLGCCVSLYALMTMAYNAIIFLIYHEDAFLLGLSTGFAYAIIGVALFALSKPLAALITRSLESDDLDILSPLIACPALPLLAIVLYRSSRDCKCRAWSAARCDPS